MKKLIPFLFISMLLIPKQTSAQSDGAVVAAAAIVDLIDELLTAVFGSLGLHEGAHMLARGRFDRRKPLSSHDSAPTLLAALLIS